MWRGGLGCEMDFATSSHRQRWLYTRTGLVSAGKLTGTAGGRAQLRFVGLGQAYKLRNGIKNES